MDNEDVITGLNEQRIKEYSKNTLLKKIIKNEFKQCSNPTIVSIIKLLLRNKKEIKVTDINVNYKKFLQYNKSKFENNILNKDVLNKLKFKLNEKINIIQKGIQPLNEEIMEKIDEDTYIITNHIKYKDFEKHIGDNDCTGKYVYDFEKPDLVLNSLKNNTDLQLVSINILSKLIHFNYTYENSYYCDTCDTTTTKKAWKTKCSNDIIRCEGTVLSSKNVPKQCCRPLGVDIENSSNTDAYIYNITYKSEDKTKTLQADAISFLELETGHHESVLYNINTSDRSRMVFIIATKKKESKRFDISELDKPSTEHNILRFNRSLNKHIKKESKELIGMLPIKLVFILQKMGTIFDLDLIFNICIIGEGGAGKTVTAKRMLNALNGHRNLSTKGKDISIPGLRGTRDTIVIFNKKKNIITFGYLGSYTTIHIDEIGQNPQVLEDLKGLLLDMNYNYLKAGSDDLNKKRTAHLVITHNINKKHVNYYIKMIHNKYDKLTANRDDVDEWDQNWDLFQPLYYYDFNIHLYNIIKFVRDGYTARERYWLDGYELALKDRFPFYFYINKKESYDMDFYRKFLTDSNKNKDEDTELCENLENETVDDFFNSLKNYSSVLTKYCDEDFLKLLELLKLFQIDTDLRNINLYYNILKLLCIIDKRYKIEDKDFEILQYLLENMNQKINANDLIEFELKNEININVEKLKNLDDKIKNNADVFKIYGDE